MPNPAGKLLKRDLHGWPLTTCGWMKLSVDLKLALFSAFSQFGVRAIFNFFKVSWRGTIGWYSSISIEGLTYNQINNNLTSQAAEMSTHGLPNDILSNLDPFALLILIPICDVFVRKHWLLCFYGPNRLWHWRRRFTRRFVAWVLTLQRWRRSPLVSWLVQLLWSGLPVSFES